MTGAGTNAKNPMRRLKSFARKSGQASSASPLVEACDLCATTLARRHQHLLEPATRKLVCSCDACSILFDFSGRTRYLRVPRNVRRLPDFKLPEGARESLTIPVGLGFIYRSSHAGGLVALYPSPAGMTESLLEDRNWAEVVAANPELAELLPDVEALLINRLKGSREAYLAPIDRCFEIAGILRTHWRGFTGGDRVWQEVGKYLAEMRTGIGGEGAAA